MKDKKYIIFLVAIIVLYVFYELQKPKQLNWTSTYHANHSIPFGALATHDLMKDLFDDQALTSAYKTVYELVNEDSIQDNLLIIADGVGMDPNDVNALLKYVNGGGTAMISARNFGGDLLDTLGFAITVKDETLAYDFEAIQAALTGEALETVSLKFGDEESRVYPFSTIATMSYFSSVEEDNFDILAVNEADQPVLMAYKGTKGNLYLSTMPLAFTNYFVLGEETAEFTSNLMSLFPKDTPLLHNEYYQLGRLEAQTPLRVVLSNPSLKWAFFILSFTLLIFIFFESKRRQRIIPLITPLKNMSIEFVETLGRLYYRQSDHRKLAAKRVNYWKDFVRGHYNLRTDHFDERFAQGLANKSGQSLKSINVLLEFIKRVEAGVAINQGELMQIEKQLNAFYGIK